MGLGEVVYGVFSGLVGDAVNGQIIAGASSFLEKKRMENVVEQAVLGVVEPLCDFLANEGVSEDQQQLLIQTCGRELQPLVDTPEQLFRAGLDGESVFARRYADRSLPEEITDERLEGVYHLLFQRVASVVCQFAVGVESWRVHGFREGFRLLQEISQGLAALFVRLDQLDPTAGSGSLFARARRTRAQGVHLRLDLSGLRAGKERLCRFDDMFVHPALRESEGREKSAVVNTANETTAKFLAAGGRHLVFAGAGMGKTTWTRWLERASYDPGRASLAIRVELRHLSDEHPSMLQLLCEAIGVHLAAELTAPIARSWVETGQVVLLLDGFDEVRPGRRDEVYRWMAEIGVAYPNAALIVTSRPLATSHLTSSDGWSVWEMCEYDRPRVEEFIRKWHLTAPDLNLAQAPNAARLATIWWNDHTVYPLTTNPLLLATLLMVHHLDGKLPAGRAALYRRYVDGMLGSWDDRRGISESSVSLSEAAKRQILTRLATEMMLAETEQFDEHAAKSKVVDEGPWDPEAALATLHERSGLLVGPGVYSFTHKTIAEYLVAEAIVQGVRIVHDERFDRHLLWRERHGDRWNSVLFFWAGLCPARELQDFIEVSVDNDEHAVSLGLIFDQWERIPQDCIDLAVEAALRVAMPVDGGSGWIEPSGSGFRIPGWQIRSMSDPTPYVETHNVISRLRRADRLRIPDLGTLSNDGRILLLVLEDALSTLGPQELLQLSRRSGGKRYEAVVLRRHLSRCPMAAAIDLVNYFVSAYPQWDWWARAATLTRLEQEDAAGQPAFETSEVLDLYAKVPAKYEPPPDVYPFLHRRIGARLRGVPHRKTTEALRLFQALSPSP